MRWSKQWTWTPCFLIYPSCFIISLLPTPPFFVNIRENIYFNLLLLFWSFIFANHMSFSLCIFFSFFLTFFFSFTNRMHGSLLLIKYMYGFIITSPRDKKLLSSNRLLWLLTLYSCNGVQIFHQCQVDLNFSNAKLSFFASLKIEFVYDKQDRGILELVFLWSLGSWLTFDARKYVMYYTTNIAMTSGIYLPPVL